MKRRLALVVLAVCIGLAWRPILQPAGQGAILILDLFAPLIGVNLAQLITPEPRVEETREGLHGVETRVTWWRPGWGDSHAAVIMVNGATPQGNDNAATRQLGAALARAGFLAVLPEFVGLKEGRFDPDLTRQLDSAVEQLRRRPETDGRTIGAFGASVGGAALLAAAGGPGWAAGTDYIVVLGGYYDFDTYLASAVSWSQQRDGRVVPWVPSLEVRERLPPAAIAAVPAADRPAVSDALRATSYDVALERIRALPRGAREVFDALSPETVWARVAPPVFWLHDPNDEFEPVAEAEAARDAPRRGRFTLVVPGLVQHAEVAGARGRGPLEIARELGTMLGMVIEILRLAR
ncbi:MAG TPA: hypothetical protein VFW12_04480 [Candidatus Limnocylindria bacterium]|nr:hypothetical protein [Candidatus Limnocylindria bacterium]